MNLRLPSLNFELPEWKSSELSVFHRCSLYYENLGKTAGTSSDAFAKAKAAMKRHVLIEGHERVISLLNTHIDIRAYLDLLLNDKPFFEEVTFYENDLERFSEIADPMSKLALAQLIRFYFFKFDELADQEQIQLTRVADFIKAQLNSFQSLKMANLAKLKSHQDMLFHCDGPVHVATYAQDNDKDLDQVMLMMGLHDYSDSRFNTLSRLYYYIKTLETIPSGQDHAVLAELQKPAVFEVFLDSQTRLGHKVIEILIDRTLGDISDVWRKLILQIAGDPRVPKTSRRYREWWGHIDPAKIQRFIGWMSKLDLAVFLEVLLASARSSRNEDMERMFPSRKAFLEGLLKEHTVIESRLFLSAEARNFLKNSQYRYESLSYAEVTSTKTSMIYMRLVNDVHLIEGSHSFKLKLLNKLPAASRIANWSKTSFSDYELRTQLVGQYINEFGYTNGYEDIVHNQNGVWQHKAIDYMQRMAVPLSVESLFTPDDYWVYRRRYGL